MMEWLESNHILENVYGDSMHNELLKRSFPLLRFYNRMGALSKDKLLWLWKLSKEKHAVFKAQILKNLSDLVKSFDFEKI